MKHWKWKTKMFSRDETKKRWSGHIIVALNMKGNFRFIRTWVRRAFLIAAVAMAIGAAILWEQYGRLIPTMMAADRDRAALPRWTGGTNGIIAATTGGYPVEAGLKVLKEGGNAADAALTTALAETVRAAGSYVSFAGAMVALYYDAHTGKVYSLNAGYNVPLKENDPLSIPPTGGRTVLVPGFMAGVQALHDRFGKLPFQRLFEPSIMLAENGEPVYGLLGWQIQSRKPTLAGFPKRKAYSRPKTEDSMESIGSAAPIFFASRRSPGHWRTWQRTGHPTCMKGVGRRGL